MDLGTLWRRWTEIVRLFACRRERRFAVDPDEYHVLHAELLALCREMQNRSETERLPPLQEAQDILAPWGTVDSLAKADKQIVCELLDRCSLAQQVLDGRSATRSNWRLRRIVLLGAVLSIVLGALLTISNNMHFTIWEPLPELQRWILRAAQITRVSGVDPGLLIGGAVVCLTAIALVWRSPNRF